jgi:predicted RNase H-like nuclease
VGVGHMRAVLGIDAAWTLTQPSGVALAAELSSSWRLIAAASSYQRFQTLADPRLLREQRPSGSLPDAPTLLASASILCGGPVDLVAIDMPLAHTPIVGRRISDNAVSRAYGGRKCGTHTPNELRPGRLSDLLREGFDLAGYPLLTNTMAPRGLIEVYPHPALVELAGASIRLPYKTSKIRSYWPSATPLDRRVRLYQQWSGIVALLEGEITGVGAALPRLEMSASGVEVKAYEDALDAIICAWVAICVLEGRARPFGDENSAIWIPNPLVTSVPPEAAVRDPSQQGNEQFHRSWVNGTLANLKIR